MRARRCSRMRPRRGAYSNAAVRASISTVGVGPRGGWLLAWAAPGGELSGQPSQRDVEWRSYGNDSKEQRFSPLTQIKL
jgi:hypothetical protein